MIAIAFKHSKKEVGYDFELSLNVLDRIWRLNGIMKSENCVLNKVRVSTAGPHLPTQASVEYPLHPPGLHHVERDNR